MSANYKAPHILSTSANLAGFCFFVIASIKALGFRESSIIDEVTAIAMSLFIFSSLLSFLSLRTNKEKLSNAYEKSADIIFLLGLFLIFIITLMITFNLV